MILWPRSTIRAPIQPRRFHHLRRGVARPRKGAPEALIQTKLKISMSTQERFVSSDPSDRNAAERRSVGMTMSENL
jgi:hypothetical protein